MAGLDRLTACALAALLLAGCAGHSKGSSGTTTTLGSDLAVEVTQTTGGIRGVVVDPAIVPIANVTVTLLGGTNLTATTGPSGGFAFSNLPAGTYFMRAVRFGFFPVQASTDVVAGVKEPPIVKIQMVRDLAAIAYFSAQKQDGYIVCTTSVVAVCGAPNVVSNILLCPAFNVCLGNVTDDRFGLNFFYDANATVIQSEMFWESTQSLSTELTLEMENLGNCTKAGDSYIKDTTGNSPLFNRLNETDVQDGSIGGNCPLFHSVFSGQVAGTPAGVTVQQRFTIISHAFYRYAPPDEWRFSATGEVPQPPS